MNVSCKSDVKILCKLLKVTLLLQFHLNAKLGIDFIDKESCENVINLQNV